MKHPTFLAIVGLATLFALPLLAGAQVESTPIPQQPKPDLSPMSFLVGTWNCSTQSSRRPAPFKTTITYVMDPTGYWINQTSVTAPMSWFPKAVTAYDKITYDSQMKRWVDINYDEQGGYGYSVTLPGSMPDRMVWHDMTGATGDPSIASNGDTTWSRQSATHVTTTSSFKEQTGRVVTVTSTCTKQS